jgi:hypothetical protein
MSRTGSRRTCTNPVGPITCWVGRLNGTPVYRRNPPHPGRLFFRCYQVLHLPRLLLPSGRFVCENPCPLYPRKRTLLSVTGMSALCQKRTRAPQQFRRYSITWSAIASSGCDGSELFIESVLDRSWATAFFSAKRWTGLSLVVRRSCPRQSRVVGSGERA